MCGLEVGSGPPTTTGLPRERQSSISRSVSACCGNIPPVKTRSAQAKSSSVIDAVLQLVERGRADQHRHTVTVLAKVLLLEGLDSPSHSYLCPGARGAVTPFRRC